MAANSLPSITASSSSSSYSYSSSSSSYSSSSSSSSSLRNELDLPIQTNGDSDRSHPLTCATYRAVTQAMPGQPASTGVAGVISAEKRRLLLPIFRFDSPEPVLGNCVSFFRISLTLPFITCFLVPRRVLECHPGQGQCLGERPPGKFNPHTQPSSYCA